MILKKIKQKKMSDLNSGHQSGNTIHDMLSVLFLFLKKKTTRCLKSKNPNIVVVGKWGPWFFLSKNSFSTFFYLKYLENT